MKTYTFLFIILNFLFSLVSVCQVNSDSLHHKKFNKNFRFEILGMRSIVFQKEPFPYKLQTPSSGISLSGYIPRATNSFQIGFLKDIFLQKNFWLSSGFQYKFIHSKFEKVDSTLVIPGINNPEFKYSRNCYLTFTNYLMLKRQLESFGIGISLFYLNVTKVQFNLNPINLKFPLNWFSSILFRYEKKIKIINNQNAMFLLELESANRRRDYFQIKLGLAYKIN